MTRQPQAEPIDRPHIGFAGMKEWDKAHKEGVTSWPAMMVRCFDAMKAAEKEEPPHA